MKNELLSLKMTKVYVKSCDPDCKILYILVNLNGIVVVAVGFISGHRALDFKPVSDMKMKICHAENEDENFSIFQKIEFTLWKVYQLDPQDRLSSKMYLVLPGDKNCA